MMQGLPDCLRVRSAVAAAGAALMLLALSAPAGATPGNYPITPQQRATARQVAEAGVPLADLAPNAPDTYTIVRGDTLWDISKMYLKSPWRWPELWGMNLEEIRNPHLIYPGQVLVLEKIDGRARLRVAGEGQPNGTVKLEPRVRSEPIDKSPISAIPLHLITPFLAAAIGLTTNEAAYMAEIIRGGFESVNRGQTEAASSLGLRPRHVTFRILLPQAMKVIVPVIGNQTIAMLKNSSLVSCDAMPILCRRLPLVKPLRPASTTNSEIPLCAFSGFGSVFATTMTRSHSWPFEMNVLLPLRT